MADVDLIHIFYMAVHIAVIAVNTFGWLFLATRKFSLAVQLLTLASWTIGGYFYGWGYCFLTDLHYQHLYSSGVRDLPNSYMKYLFDLWMPWDISPEMTDAITAAVFFLSILFAWVLYLRQRKGIKNLEK